jgi:hypothetical protein
MPASLCGRNAEATADDKVGGRPVAKLSDPEDTRIQVFARAKDAIQFGDRTATDS